MFSVQKHAGKVVSPAYISLAYLFLLVVGFLGLTARASMTVLIGEPYGGFGTMLPVGHAAIYLDRVCADTPLHLRMCRPDEPMGVVVSRYHHLRDLDWMASPVLEYLYAVERPDQVPRFVTKDTEAELREEFRRNYLQLVIPDGTERAKQNNEWYETAGAALDRRVWGYQIHTTIEQDERFVAEMNARVNHRRYHVITANCANFVADIVNMYYPRAVRPNRIADWGIVTPKHLARSMVSLQKKHPEVRLRVLEIPQIPGTLRRSRPTRGISEFFLKTKRYSFTLAVIQPEAVIATLILYESNGRFRLGTEAEKVEPQFWAGQNGGDVIETETTGVATEGGAQGDSLAGMPSPAQQQK
jgi:hypothetical protein